MLYIKLYSAVFLFFKTLNIFRKNIYFKTFIRRFDYKFFNKNKRHKAPIEQRVADSSYKDLISLVPLTL